MMQYCQEMNQPRPTQTSYAVLGLLSLRVWTAYDLVQQSERSLRWFFPRAERAVYLEVKRLVKLGWASSEHVVKGRRTTAAYSITDAGRQALRDWLGQPSAPGQMELEGAMKTFFGDQGSPADLRAAIADVGMQADLATAELEGQAAGVLEGRTAFPDRISTTVLSMKLIFDIHQTISEWARWAEGAAVAGEVKDPAAIHRETVAALESMTTRSRAAQKRLTR